MTPFSGIKTVPPIKAAGVRASASVWDLETVFSRLYDKAMEHKLNLRQPGLGIRHGDLRVPDPFEAGYEVMFPIAGEIPGKTEGIEILELPGEEMACFIHRGPYASIGSTYEKVLDWLRENLYEVAGEPREVFLVAPEPYGGGTQDDMLTEIQVPVRLRSLEEKQAGSRGRRYSKAA